MLSEYRRKYGRASDVLPGVGDTFERICLFVVTEGYKRMKHDNNYNLSWKETRFSAHLIGYMRKVRQDKDLHLIIDPENHLYGKEVLEGEGDPDTAPRIDIRIMGGWVNEDIYYAVEGKILVEDNWGTRNNHDLRARYIDTGIDNFVSGQYSPEIPRGCILGYVVQGSPENIVMKINGLLEHRGRDTGKLGNRQCINGYPDCYMSEHTRTLDEENIRLQHLILLLAT